MVTKLIVYAIGMVLCSVLAKIHMVTKRNYIQTVKCNSSVLAKIHMVTKLMWKQGNHILSSVLAKIHMVTKP